MTTTREKRRRARDDLSLALKSRGNAFAVHYACESFDLPAPRVVALAARNFGTSATKSFSLDQTASAMGVAVSGVSPSDLDRIEKKMLDDFFAFVRLHQGHHWVHWNMRDAKFGFEALENRHRALKGKPATIAQAHRFDISSRLFDLYGDRHTPKGQSRLRFLAEKNEITLIDFAEGAAQAQMIATGDYVAVHRSTLRKADVIFEVADRAERDKLKTSAPFLDPYGGWTGAAHWLRDHPAYIAIIVLGGIIGVVAKVAGLFG